MGGSHIPVFCTFLTNTRTFASLPSRLPEVLHNQADGLGGVELGAGREVAVLEGFVEVAAAANPGVQAVEGHVGIAAGEVEQGQFGLSIFTTFTTGA